MVETQHGEGTSLELQRAKNDVLHIASEVTQRIEDPFLGKIFTACFSDGIHDVQSLVVKDGKPYTHIKTGDIPAMWLRDASIQVIPYLRFVKESSALKQLILGVINQEVVYVLRDPYANAYMQEETAKSPHRYDKTDMKPGVFERKWEPDSLSQVIHLSYLYWKATDGDTSFVDDTWKKAMAEIVQTFHEQQRLEGEGSYAFIRPFAKLLGQTNEIVPHNGFGRPTKKIGLIHTTHRPSDDVAKYPFNIPENLFAIQTMRELSEMYEQICNDTSSANHCMAFANSLQEAVTEYGVVQHPQFGSIYAYEIDGLGNTLLMDDANIPGFLSLEFDNNTILEDTRRFALSKANEYFFDAFSYGQKYEGVGSPHTGKNNIWPLSIIMRALTSHDKTEIAGCLAMLKEVATHDYRFNESVTLANPKIFTRADFGMANSMMAELLLKILDDAVPTRIVDYE